MLVPKTQLAVAFHSVPIALVRWFAEFDGWDAHTKNAFTPSRVSPLHIGL
jgi:hypothetical protein